MNPESHREFGDSGDQLQAPIPLEPGASFVYRPSLMLLNAAQLAERSCPGYQGAEPLGWLDPAGRSITLRNVRRL